MILYTTNEIYSLLLNATCKQDLVNTWQYIVENKYQYCIDDLQNFKIVIELLSIVYDE